ncbi:MAG: hypothetical protein EXR65_01925 [Dehalococcoidia bacterium]|nr:hypothetical protein [Dehalococcoidia bacterium]
MNVFPTVDLNVACYAGGAYRLFGVDVIANVTEHTRGVVSAGSGSPFAEHAIAIFDHISTYKE